jgi:hypothetical protein
MDLRAEFPNELKFDLDPGASSAMEELRSVIAIESPAPRDDVLRIVRRAETNCHAVQSLRKPVPVLPSSGSMSRRFLWKREIAERSTTQGNVFPPVLLVTVILLTDSPAGDTG